MLAWVNYVEVRVTCFMGSMMHAARESCTKITLMKTLFTNDLIHK